MPDQPPRADDELLSAYFDGEVTAEERARVEGLRAASPAVAAELEAYAELSQLLGGLPRPSAPPEIGTSVMRVVERSALLKPHPVQSRKPWQLVREAGFFLAGALAAACVLLAISVNSPERNHNDLVAHSLRTPAPAEAGKPVRAVPLDEAASPAVDDLMMTATRETLSSDGVGPLAADPGDAALGVRRAERMAGSGAVTALAATPPVENNDTAAPNSAVVPLSDVLPILAAESETRVSNLEVYSRNPERSIEQFQKILVSNGVVFDPDEKERLSEKERQFAVETKTDRWYEVSQLPAVYVEAPQEPLARTLEEWSLQPELVQVRLRPPLELPVELEAGEAGADRRLRRQDVEEKVKLAYVLANSDFSEEAPVSAMDALAIPQLNETIAANSASQREMRFSRSRTAQGGGVQRSEAVNPVPDLGANLQRRLTVPTPTEANRVNQLYGQNFGDHKVQQNDEVLLRQRMANYNALVNTSHVRMLIVFQEAGTPAPAASTPAAPAARP